MATGDLKPDEKRVLGHFWNPSRKEIRGKLPLAVLAFLDAEAQGKEYTPTQVPLPLDALPRLAANHFIRQWGGPYSESGYELDVEGRTFIERTHPRLFVLWDRLVERTPRPVAFLTFGFGLFGVFAGILGVIDHYSKR
jgi:hypothetical protein